MTIETGTRELLGESATLMERAANMLVTTGRSVDELSDCARRARAAASLPSGDGERDHSGAVEFTNAELCCIGAAVYDHTSAERDSVLAKLAKLTPGWPAAASSSEPAPPSGETGERWSLDELLTHAAVLDAAEAMLRAEPEIPGLVRDTAFGLYCKGVEAAVAWLRRWRAPAPPAGETGVNAAAFRRATTAGLDWSKLTPTQRESWAGETGDGRGDDA